MFVQTTACQSVDDRRLSVRLSVPYSHHLQEAEHTVAVALVLLFNSRSKFSECYTAESE